MPVLSGIDPQEAFDEFIYSRHDEVAIGNCQRATGTEIILQIDDD